MHKFFTISKVRVWKHDDYGMSGFEVTWKGNVVFSAFPPIRYMFGEQTYKTDYMVIEVNEVLTGIKFHYNN